MALPAENLRLIQKLALLAVAGSLGTLARYGLGGVVPRIFGTSFPWGTYVINALGCLAFGFVWALGERTVLSGEMRIIILIGFMGAFTTFSSFAFETGSMIRDGQWLLALGNILLQNVSGLIMFFLGLGAGQRI